MVMTVVVDALSGLLMVPEEDLRREIGVLKGEVDSDREYFQVLQNRPQQLLMLLNYWDDVEVDEHNSEANDNSSKKQNSAQRQHYSGAVQYSSACDI